jgi:general secretion pathway protein H
MARRQRAFTLVELLVVLTIAGLMMALVPPMLSKGMPTLRLQGAVRDAAAGLRLARSEAVRTGTERVFRLDREARRMEVPGTGKARPLPEDVEVSLTTAEDAIVDDAVAAFRFFPDGSSTGGNLVLGIDRRRYRIAVDWLSGRIDVAAL